MIHNVERIYIKHFFQELLVIFQDEKKLITARQTFQDNKPEQSSRYTAVISFGLGKWPPDSAELFTAAVAEALLNTMTFFLNQNGFDDFENDAKIPDEQFTKALHAHDNKIRRSIIPMFVWGIDPGYPLLCMSWRIQQQIERYQEPKSFLEENKSLFFKMATAVAAAGVVARVLLS